MYLVKTDKACYNKDVRHKSKQRNEVKHESNSNI